MRKNNKLAGTYFCGNKVSDYAIEQGYLDYATFVKAFDAVLNNDIIAKTQEIGYWEEENGMIDNSEEIENLENKLDNELSSLDDDEEEEIRNINSEIKEIQKRIEELEEEQDYQQEIYQYYIVSDKGAEIIQAYTNDPLFYNEELDMYVWGVTHWGTSWSYVLTDVKLNCGYDY